MDTRLGMLLSVECRPTRECWFMHQPAVCDRKQYSLPSLSYCILRMCFQSMSTGANNKDKINEIGKVSAAPPCCTTSISHGAM